MESAERLFSSNGYRNTTIKDITSGAGLAVGSFYLYFESKKQLYIYIMKRFSMQMQEYLDSRCAGVEDVIEKQVSYIVEFVRYAQQNPACYNLIFESIYIDQRLFYDYYYNYAMRYVPIVERNGMSKEMDPVVWSYISMGIGNFLGLKILAEGNVKERDYKILERTVRHLLTKGILD